MRRRVRGRGIAGEGRKLPALDRMQHHDAYIDAESHHVQQTIYLAQGNTSPRDATDYFEILSSADPESIKASSRAQSNLESHADTPSFDQG